MSIRKPLILTLMLALTAAAAASGSQPSEEERLARNLQTLKSDQYYQFMDGVDRLISDGQGFDDAAYNKLNALFSELKRQDAGQFAVFKRDYPEVFKNLEVK